jgi:hypothetical protein
MPKFTKVNREPFYREKMLKSITAENGRGPKKNKQQRKTAETIFTTSLADFRPGHIRPWHF